MPIIRSRRTNSVFTTVTNVTSSPYTVVDSDQVILVNSSSAVTINLPASASNTSRYIHIKDISFDAAKNNITIDGNSSELVENAATFVIGTDGGCATLYCNGTAWYVI